MNSAVTALFVLFATLAVIVSAQSSADTCDSTLYVGAGGWWSTVEFRRDPTPYSGNSQACGDYFAAGAEQCCDDATYTSLDNAWSTARSNIENARDNVANSISTWEAARDAWEQNRGAVADRLNEVPSLTDEQKEAILNAYDRTFELYDEFIRRAVNYYANCLESILKYFVGLVCLGCDPQASRFYVTGSGVSGTQLKLTVDTCNEMKSDCQPFWQLVFDFIVGILEVNAQLISAFSGGDFSFSASTDVSFCDGGDCGAWICNSFYGGVDVETGAVPLGPTVKRVADSWKSLEENLQSRHSDLSLKPVAVARENIMSMVKTLSDLHAQRQSSVSNTYVSSGDAYAPYTVAAKSSLATSVQDADADSAPQITSWIF